MLYINKNDNGYACANLCYSSVLFYNPLRQEGKKTAY